MKILMLASWYPTKEKPYAGIFVQDLVYALKKHAPELDLCVAVPEPHYVTPRAPTSFLQAFSIRRRMVCDREKEVLVCRFPYVEWSPKLPGGFPKGALRGWRSAFRDLCSRWGMPDLIHAQVGLPAGWLASHSRNECGIHYIITEHMSPFPFPSLIREGQLVPELRVAYAQADAIVAVSPSLARTIRSYGLAESVHVIPNVVDEEHFHPPARSPRNPFTFFFLGHLGKQKGVDVLLSAIALWHPPKDVRFVLAGGATKRELVAFRELAQRLGVIDQVEWLGPLERQQAAEHMQRSHVFVLPSRHESFGVVIAEALACGVPVIATRCGGPEFIVRDKRVGRLVPVDDAQALAHAMQDVFEHYDAFSSQTIRDYFLNRFSARATVQKLVHLYESVVHGR